ncbi:MAG: heme-binding protein [Elioraea sp.]|nr:heme-binding protein [Elioraea sp.]MDW8443348.1 heme-binding protein [Acetobacteraceae bacterium]
MRMTLLATAALTAALAGGEARAAADDFTTFRVMTPELALDLALAALKECRNRGYQVAVAVTDRFGLVQVVLRDRLAGQHTPDTAIGKARTAVSFRSDTLTLAEVTEAGQLNSGIRHLPGFVFLGGGVPVEAGGMIVGGIGISGAPGGGEDDACAKAGIAAVEDRLQM